MADHKIQVTRQVIGGVEHAVPDIPKTGMNVNDTVTYLCPDGELTITFPNGSPFAKTSIPGGEVNTLIRGGVFQSGCSIKIANKTIGWQPPQPVQPPSGGFHDIQPH